MQQTEFDNMAIWGLVSDVERLLNQMIEESLPLPSDSRTRIRELIGHARSHKANNPAFLNVALLNEPVQYWQAAAQHLNYYVNQHIESYLGQAITNLEDCLIVWARWPAATPRGGAARIAREQYEEYAASLEGSNDRLREKLAQILEEADARVAHLSGVAVELGQQLEGAQRELTTMRVRYQELEAQSAKEVATISASFEKTQAGWDRLYNTFLEDRSKDFVKAADPYLSRGVEIVEEGEATLAALKGIRQEVEGTASLAVGSILAKDHGSYAQREWWTGIVAYFLGFAFLSIGGVVLWSTVHGIGADQTVSWQFVALKAGLTGAAAAAAAVAFRLGGQSLGRSSANKRQELELRAIGPFLAAVGDDKASEKARIDYLARTFGRVDDKPAESDAPSLSIDQLVKLLSAFGSGKAGG